MSKETVWPVKDNVNAFTNKPVPEDKAKKQITTCLLQFLLVVTCP